MTAFQAYEVAIDRPWALSKGIRLRDSEAEIPDTNKAAGCRASLPNGLAVGIHTWHPVQKGR